MTSNEGRLSGAISFPKSILIVDFNMPKFTESRYTSVMCALTMRIETEKRKPNGNQCGYCDQHLS